MIPKAVFSWLLSGLLMNSLYHISTQVRQWQRYPHSLASHISAQCHHSGNIYCLHAWNSCCNICRDWYYNRQQILSQRYYSGNSFCKALRHRTVLPFFLILLTSIAMLIIAITSEILYETYFITYFPTFPQSRSFLYIFLSLRLVH